LSADGEGEPRQRGCSSEQERLEMVDQLEIRDSGRQHPGGRSGEAQRDPRSCDEPEDRLWVKQTGTLQCEFPFRHDAIEQTILGL
jgi:hypothetical protein